MNLLIQVAYSTLLILLLTTGVYAQVQIDNFIHTSANAHQQTDADISNYLITSSHVSMRSGVAHYYIQQQHANIPIHNAVMGIHVKSNGELLTMDNQFISNVVSKINTETPALDAQKALEVVAQTLQYDLSNPPVFKEQQGNVFIFSPGSIADTDIRIQLMYQPMEDATLRLAWDMAIDETQDADYLSIRADALTGEILSTVNWTVYCDFDANQCTEEGHVHQYAPESQANQQEDADASFFQPDSYRVYPEPVESPIHGGRQLIVNPADAIASPFGWHDTNGANGAEHTITRGNNVWAQEDANGNNGTGFSPNGTASLDFDFAVDLNANPNTDPSRSAAITNLFYWNNLIHDVWYQYGFDEASGNFQQNNYGNGGTAGDYVLADAQDGSGTNNANFSTPSDGGNGRMQMFIWLASVDTLNVNAPGNIAGLYSTIKGSFGQQTFDVTGDLIIVDDASAAPTEGCNTLINGGAINGNIAVVDRGNCEFGVKCLNAQNAGAIAVIVCNNVPGGTLTMAPGAVGASVTIPTVMISQADCATIRTQIPTVNVNLKSGTTVTKDSDFDNGIIVHEYGHGISNRLTGGRNNSGCLFNDEQMGEGWSDWFGLIMTIEPTDIRTDIRPIGTFAQAQATTSNGIRPYPYTTDLSINPHVYTDIANVSIPHGVGSVWCAMLWEMTWDLIDTYGFDPDLHYGTGGNNIAMALVTEGLKLQPCSPGFVNGRDAILAADQVLYSGANQCLIKNAFARRGLGDNATQGSANSVTDGSNDFVLPCVSCATIDLDITFDGFPGQTLWNITDSGGNIVASGGNYGGQPNNSTLTENACLPDGCYNLNFFDSVGNGMCPFQSTAISSGTFITPGTLISAGSVAGTLSTVVSPGLCGNYTLSDTDGTVLANGGGGFGTAQTNAFCLSGGVAPLIGGSISISNNTHTPDAKISITPTLASHTLTVNYTLEETSNVQLSIIDLTGKIIQQKNITALEGMQQTQLDVSSLISGYYFFQFINKNSITTLKFIKN